MARYRISRPAQVDLVRILTLSQENWGAAGRTRYAAAITHAMQRIAADPTGPTTRDRTELAPGLRSLHLRHVTLAATAIGVRRPVHVLFYRLASADLVEIVRVLHERMEPSRHRIAQPGQETYP